MPCMRNEPVPLLNNHLYYLLLLSMEAKGGHDTKRRT